MAVMLGSVAPPAVAAAAPAPDTRIATAKQTVAAGGDPQTGAGVADAVARGPEEQERRDRLDGEEVRDDEQRDRRVAARPDPDPDDRRPEPDQRRDRQRPGDPDEMAPRVAASGTAGGGGPPRTSG